MFRSKFILLLGSVFLGSVSLGKPVVHTGRMKCILQTFQVANEESGPAGAIRRVNVATKEFESDVQIGVDPEQDPFQLTGDFQNSYFQAFLDAGNNQIGELYLTNKIGDRASAFTKGSSASVSVESTAAKEGSQLLCALKQKGR